jgi:DNA-binding XRE family transcriptional regulator
MPEYLTVEDVVKLLKEARGEQTLEQFAKKVGVSYQFCAHIERGVRQPGKKILKFLGLKKLTHYTYIKNGR